METHGSQALGRRGHDVRPRGGGDRACEGGGDLHALSSTTLEAALREAGATALPELLPVVDLLVVSGLAKSKGEARRTVSEGGAYLNNVRIEDPEAEPQASDLIGGSWLVLRRGKKQFAGVEVV